MLPKQATAISLGSSDQMNAQSALVIVDDDGAARHN